MLIHFYRIANFFYRKKIPFLPNFIYIIQYLLFNSSVPPSVQIGRRTKFAYGGIAIVIHARAVIGNDCTIGQCCTIGGRSKHHDVPVIGDNVYLGAGSKVLGPVKIGNNVVIGANAVVINDIPSDCVVVGVPARIIRTEINVDDYV
jgi:serine O-acetyltransferase